MSIYSDKILNETDNNCEKFPSIDKINSYDDLEILADYLMKEYNLATNDKIIEIIKPLNMNDTEKAILFILLDRETFAVELCDYSLEFYKSLDIYLQSNISLLQKFAPKPVKTAYSFFRNNQELSDTYYEYAKEIAVELQDLSTNDKLDIIKEILGVEKITAEILSIDTVVFEHKIIKQLSDELNLEKFVFDKKILYVMDIERPIAQTIILNEVTLRWELENRIIQKLNSWVDRAKEAIASISLSSFMAPEKKKIAIGALALGLAVNVSTARADMNTAANNLNQLGNMLSERIGNVDNVGECRIGTKIIKKSKHHVEAQVYFGDYRIDVQGTGYDAGISKSSNVRVRIAKLKAESDCVLDYEQAQKLAATVKKIVKNQ